MGGEGEIGRYSAGTLVCKITKHTWRKSKNGCRQVSTAEPCIRPFIKMKLHTALTHAVYFLQPYTSVAIIMAIPVNRQRLVAAGDGEGRVSSGTRVCGCDS